MKILIEIILILNGSTILDVELAWCLRIPCWFSIIIDCATFTKLCFRYYTISLVNWVLKWHGQRVQITAAIITQSESLPYVLARTTLKKIKRFEGIEKKEERNMIKIPYVTS